MERYAHEDKLLDEPESCDVLTISARNEALLQRLAERYSTYLAATDWKWNEICQTAGAGRSALAERLAVVAKGREEAAGKLLSWLNGEAVSGVYRGHVRTALRGEPEKMDKLTPESVAELFVRGGHVDWKSRGAGKGLRRAELPTYPFERERYWFEERQNEAEEGRAIQAEPIATEPQLRDLRLLLADVSAEERLKIIRNFLRDHVAAVLELNAAEIDEERPLAELGMDSLMALELKHRVEKSSGLTLPANFLFAYPTIRQAEAYLNAMTGLDRKDMDLRVRSSDYEDVAL
jgi:acyl transferase domain-containing protein